MGKGSREHKLQDSFLEEQGDSSAASQTGKAKGLEERAQTWWEAVLKWVDHPLTNDGWETYQKNSCVAAESYIVNICPSF